jgi:hypothetical protein
MEGAHDEFFRSLERAVTHAERVTEEEIRRTCTPENVKAAVENVIKRLEERIAQDPHGMVCIGRPRHVC